MDRALSLWATSVGYSIPVLVVQVTARSEARAVGMLAFRKAAWERQREESLLQSRRKLAAELSSVTDPEQAAVLLAKPLSTRFAGLCQSSLRLLHALRGRKCTFHLQKPWQHQWLISRTWEKVGMSEAQPSHLEDWLAVRCP